MLIIVEGGKPQNPEKNPRSKDENQQQTQTTTCDTGSRIWTQATLVGGERDHHCAFQDGERDSVQVRLLIIDDLTIPATATNTGCRKLSITRAKIDLRFPSYTYIIYCNFTFDNSNHVCQDVRTKKKSVLWYRTFKLFLQKVIRMNSAAVAQRCSLWNL